MKKSYDFSKAKKNPFRLRSGRRVLEGPHEIRQLTVDDLALMDALLTTFGEVFDEPSTYCEHRPSAEYQRQLLASDAFIALVAMKDGQVVGGLTAYVLQKFEQQRSEIYIYDLAVDAGHRREGIATALIEGVEAIARERGIYLIFVQADTEVEDEPAIALYSKLGSRSEILHFEIKVDQ